jgi:hypothetical protein
MPALPPPHVYNARYINDDHSPWDGNLSYGVHATLEAAQKVLRDEFRRPDEDCRWLPVRTTYTGVNPYAKTWKLFTRDGWETWEDTYTPDEDGTYPDDTGHGLYVIEEELRYAA